MKKFIEGVMLVSLNFYGYFSGKVNHVYFQPSPENRELLEAYVVLPVRLQELFYFVLDFRPAFFIPLDSILNYILAYDSSVYVV